MQDTRKETGNQGEDRASEYLIEKGYEVLFRNYRTKTGEIDIISLIDETIVFVEVKTLPNGTPELLSHVLDSRKQKRIIKTAKRFLSNYRQYNNKYIRFDVIVLNMPGLPCIYHVENAFSELL